ncbi:MAG TPA: sigma-54 dependent transcriptional regulator [Terriglobia bacterium]|nr:sigma-54 dependent transcriptional regulator [Terriglobia bacterium]
MAEILVVDDDENVCSAFRQFLKAEGHSPIIASNAEDALRAVHDRHPDVMFIDVRMPGVDGLEALRQIRTSDPNIYAIVMTAYGTSQTSIEAVRLGAFDYLHKPLDLNDVRDVIDKALAAQVLSKKAAENESDGKDEYLLINLVGSSHKMQDVYKLIGLLTTNDVPALIVGERGSGKELVAKTIHFNSGRKDREFVTVHCQTVQSDSTEVEIFGRSATNVSPAIAGRIEKAHGGTLFIDDIQYLSPAAQIKLLRLLKERVYEPSGGTETRAADVRILAGADREFAGHSAQMFHVGVYESLRLITIEVPPLRDRRDDIPDLVHHFIRLHNKELNKTIKAVDDRALDLLGDQEWHGNVSELQNVIKRACILARGDVITTEDVRDALERSGGPTPPETGENLEATVREALQQKLMSADSKRTSSLFYEIVGEVEKAVVAEALRITGGNQVRAAELLGLNRTTLRKKMNIEESEP